MLYKFIHRCTILLLLIGGTHNALLAQHGDEDTSFTIAPPAIDSVVEYDEEAQNKEDSLKRAEVNAFDTIDAVSMQTIPSRNLGDGYVQQFLKDDVFGYVKNGIPKPKIKQRKRSGIKTGDILLIIAVSAFIAFLVWYLNQRNIFLFRKKPASLSNGSVVDDEKDIFSINYAQAIENALSKKNYRLAIRLQYLQVLKMLADKSIIHYQPEKTNLDYLLQLKPTTYYNSFFSITRNYEYSWYGLFDIDEAAYRQINHAFSNFHKKIN